MTSWTLRAAALALPLVAASAAVAGESDCAVIGAAMMAVHDQSSVRQHYVATKPGGEMGVESISTKDAMYMRESASGAWRKVPMNAAQRRKLAEGATRTLPLSECESLGAETVEGAGANVYAFKQPDLMKPGAKTSSKIWIGKADGLPLRMEVTADTAMVFEYGVPAPKP